MNRMMEKFWYNLLKFGLIAWILVTAAGFASIVQLNSMEFDDPNSYDAVRELTDQYRIVGPLLFLGGLFVSFIFIYEWNQRRKIQ